MLMQFRCWLVLGKTKEEGWWWHRTKSAKYLQDNLLPKPDRNGKNSWNFQYLSVVPKVGNGGKNVSRVLFRRRELTEPH